MTDYRAPLRRALERRPDVTFEARQAVYQRARQILESQLARRDFAAVRGEIGAGKEQP